MSPARRFVLVLSGFVSLALPPVAWACGVCVEDKMAATYDHAVVQGAAAAGRVVVFCDMQGKPDAAALRRAVGKVPGVQPRSLRLSTEPAALSFVLDPAAGTPEDAARQLERAAGGQVRLTVFRTLAAKF